jgi:hypothetical protein
MRIDLPGVVMSQPSPSKNIDPQDRIERAKASGAPKVYFNGFQTALTNSDVLITAECNNEPVAILNLSFTTAKTLAKALHDTILMLEEKSGRDMLTTHDFEVIMKAPNE